MWQEHKPIPKSILIFGASGHIGGPLATFLSREAPDVKLRLSTSQPSKVDAIKESFPEAEVVVANYYDTRSLIDAAKDIEAVFVLTTGVTDEYKAMTNLIAALNPCREKLVHVIRLVGVFPEVNPFRVPNTPAFKLGLTKQHPIAKRLLDESGLPVTYLNSGATFMDNFTRHGMGRSIRSGKIIWPDRLVPFIDPVDITEVAGRLFLSPNGRHIGVFHTLNNGHDLLRMGDVAKIMSDMWGVEIQHDGSREAFFATYESIPVPAKTFLWEFFEFEKAHEEAWSLNNACERILGRKPKTLREWLKEHETELIGSPH